MFVYLNIFITFTEQLKQNAMAIAIILFVVGGLIIASGLSLGVIGKRGGSVLVVIGVIICLIWGKRLNELCSVDTNSKPKNQTVVIFDNGNNQVDKLVFESDTIHANANNIW